MYRIIQKRAGICPAREKGVLIMAEENGRNMAIACMVLGIAGLVFTLLINTLLGVIMGIVGLVLALVAVIVAVGVVGIGAGL